MHATRIFYQKLREEIDEESFLESATSSFERFESLENRIVGIRKRSPKSMLSRDRRRINIRRTERVQDRKLRQSPMFTKISNLVQAFCRMLIT